MKLWIILSKIKISNFKAIGETPLILNELASVNYLVGPNGCGKSSVLESLAGDFLSKKQITDWNFKINQKTINKEYLISYLRRQIYNSEDYIKDNFSDDNTEVNVDLTFLNINIELSHEEFQKEKKQFRLYPSDKEELNQKYFRNKMQEITNKTLFDTKFADCIFNYLRPENISTPFFTYNTFQKTEITSCILLEFIKNIESEEKMKEFISFYNKLPQYLNNQIKDISPNLSKELRLYLDNHDTHFIKDLATGYQNLFTLNYQIKEKLLKNCFNICLIEEPENGLHPEFQKMLPKIFEDLAKDFFVTFMISTHSPFIISAAGELENQQVYMIESGICINPEGNSGSEIKHRVATKMLDAQIKDFTPSKVVFCAQTEKIFLELINQFFYNLDVIFITPTPDGGDSSILKLAENTGKFANNFYPNSKIYYYTDKLETRLDNRANKLRNQSEFELITSNEPNFEAKFEQENISNKKEHAKFQAEKIIEMGEIGKREFETFFPELSPIFGFGNL